MSRLKSTSQIVHSNLVKWEIPEVVRIDVECLVFQAIITSSRVGQPHIEAIINEKIFCVENSEKTISSRARKLKLYRVMDEKKIENKNRKCSHANWREFLELTQSSIFADNEEIGCVGEQTMHE